MAGRNFNKAQSLEHEVKTLYAEVAVAGTGAPTLTSGMGIASIARSGTGLYLITFEDKYVRLMNFHGILYEATAEDIAFQVQEADVDGAKTLIFQTNTSGTKTDPSSGSVMLLKFELKNTKVGE